MGVPFSIDPIIMFSQLLGPTPPVLLDVRREDIIATSGQLIPQARIADQGDGERLAGSLDPARPVVIACAHGHNRSQRLAAHLRSEGFKASILAEGYDGWQAAGLPFIRREARGIAIGYTPTTWVTRRRPKIDRIACPWFITRFLDPDARFMFANPEWVMDIAQAEHAVAYDLPGGLFEHEGELCTFDVMLREFGPRAFAPLERLANIIRGADTDRLDIAPQAAGLLAISLGLSARHGDEDHAMMKEAFALYDGLLAWAMNASGERHNWPRPEAASQRAAS